MQHQRSARRHGTVAFAQIKGDDYAGCKSQRSIGNISRAGFPACRAARIAGRECQIAGIARVSRRRSEEPKSELQSLMSQAYEAFRRKNKNVITLTNNHS